MPNLPFRPYFPIFNVSIFVAPPSNDSMYGVSYSEVSDCANVQFLMKQLDEIYKNQNVCISLSKPGVVVVANTEAQAREIAKKNFLSNKMEHSVLFSSGANREAYMFQILISTGILGCICYYFVFFSNLRLLIML